MGTCCLAFRYYWETLLLLQNGITRSCLCYQYKVGDLDSWGIPPPSKPLVYDLWSQFHHFSIGDSLLFLYPPSEDSVIQVTGRAFNNCSIADPMAKLADGNSVFNLTFPGWYCFTSGVPGHCEKLQKLAVGVPTANGTFLPPSAEAPAAAGAADSETSASPAGAPSSYPTVFGPSAAQSSGARAMAAPAFATLRSLVVAFVAIIGFVFT